MNEAFATDWELVALVLRTYMRCRTGCGKVAPALQPVLCSGPPSLVTARVDRAGERTAPGVGFGQLTAIQSALGRAVTPSHHRSSRRECCKIRNPYNSRNEIVSRIHTGLPVI